MLIEIWCLWLVLLGEGARVHGQMVADARLRGDPAYTSAHIQDTAGGADDHSALSYGVDSLGMAGSRRLQQLHADQVDMSDAIAAATHFLKGSVDSLRSAFSSTEDITDPYLNRATYARGKTTSHIHDTTSSTSSKSRSKASSLSSAQDHWDELGSGAEEAVYDTWIDRADRADRSDTTWGVAETRGSSSRSSSRSSRSSRNDYGDMDDDDAEVDDQDALLGLTDRYSGDSFGKGRSSGSHAVGTTKDDDGVARHINGHGHRYNKYEMPSLPTAPGRRAKRSPPPDPNLPDALKLVNQEASEKSMKSVNYDDAATALKSSNKLSMVVKGIMKRRGPLQIDRARAFPVERGICGNWMANYSKLHADILAGKAPQRFAIMMSNQSGLADRLSSTITVFLYAVLTGRAFQYHWIGKHDLWKALKSDYIDWRYTAPEAKSGRVLNMSMYDANWDMGSKRDKLAYLFWHTNITALGSDYEHVIWTSNRGATYRTLFNPWLQDPLKRMGLRPATAFACLFDYLFRPTAKVMAMFQPQLRVLLEPSIIKIGIQVRVGDGALNDPEANTPFFEHFRPFFSCAQQLEAQLRPRAAPVVWFLLSDSKEVRQQAVEEYGDKVLVNLKIVVEHIQDKPVHKDVGLMAAAGEMWLFSLADMHIITRGSSYGRVGAMLASSWQNVFSVDSPALWFRACTLADAEPFSTITTDWTGI